MAAIAALVVFAHTVPRRLMAAGRSVESITLDEVLLVPVMLRQGISFWLSLAVCCALTIALYGLMTWLGPRFGLRL